MSADDKKAVDAALDLVVDPPEPENPPRPAKLANDGESGPGKRALAVVPKNCVRWAVLVGVDDYAEFSDLRFAGADVERVRERLVEFGFAPENIVALTTENGRSNSAFAPTQRNIERELSRVLDASGPDDMVFIMFTGHGLQTDEFAGYAPYVGFAPSDATANAETVVDFATTISLSKLFDDLNACKAKFKWALIDACRENLSEGKKSLDDSKRLRPPDAPAGVIVLHSCAAKEFSYEDEEFGHGLFTYYFTESLNDVGDANEDGVVTMTEAFSRAQALVRKRANSAGYDRIQTPYCRGDFTDFPLADVKTAEAKKRWSAAVKAREAGDYETALTEIEAALALMPEKAEYASEKKTIENLKRQADEASTRQKAEELAANARSAFERKDYETAQSKCEASLRLISLPDARALSAEIEKALVVDAWDAEHKAGAFKTLTIKGIEYRFRYCSAGSFTMGSPESESERGVNERQRRVELTNGFWLLETEVTQAMWKSIMGSNPSWFSSSGGGSSAVGVLNTSNFPVECVSWNDCQEFIGRLNFIGIAPKGFQFRLPTEAEWEYACRAGTTGAYASSSFLDMLGWYDNNSGGRTHKVGLKSANPWGLYDMHGNVQEWCEDVYDSSNRVLRGGSWHFRARYCRSTDRNYDDPSRRFTDCGFRLGLGREL